jgi:nitrate reductase gamma subunit
MHAFLTKFFFEIYPYICLSVFLIGSLVRFDREQYSWRSGSSQMLRPGQLRWGSNLFHVGILFLFFGHLVGLLTPPALYHYVLTAQSKQLMAILAGGVAGAICFIGLSLLLHRRIYDRRIRQTSSAMDLAVLVILWIQLVLGLVTLPFSLEHTDGSVMVRLSEWAQRIVTFRADAGDYVVGLPWPYQVHIILGLTIFLVFPFSRLVHIWSAPVWYVFRPYQIMRRRGSAATRRSVP